ncbi:MAG: hypothetical protein ACI8ZM_005285 [Crocinitomix sp.]|jgi:hypothetical protein
MTDFDEVLETEEEIKRTGVPDAVKVLAILSYIGHGFLIIIMIVVMIFFANASNTGFGQLMGPRLDEMLGVLMIVLLVFIAFSVMSIIGAAKMHKGKKIGFVLYAIGSGILGVVFLISGAQQISNLVLGLLVIGLIVGFGTQLKYLK